MTCDRLPHILLALACIALSVASVLHTLSVKWLRERVRDLERR